MFKNILLALLMALLLTKCKTEANNNGIQATTQTDTTLTTRMAVAVQHQTVYDFEITPIDSIRFYSVAQQKIVYPEPKIIQDINLIKDILKDRITIQPNKEFPDQVDITEFVTKTGKKININNYNDNSLIGYFPEEDILLFEGGHTADVTYNLTTGDTTQVAGNPEHMLLSPSKMFRLNGYFDGQECIRYFIEQNNGSVFKKVVSVNEQINTDKVPEFFCVLENHFWKDDHTIYFYMERYNGTDRALAKDYYQIKIFDKI